MNINQKKIKILKNFVRKIKFKLLIIKSINIKLDNKYNIIYGIMKRINYNFNNKTITQFKYNMCSQASNVDRRTCSKSPTNI